MEMGDGGSEKEGLRGNVRHVATLNSQLSTLNPQLSASASSVSAASAASTTPSGPE